MTKKICSYCQSEGDSERMYWQSEDGSACMCSECCLINARAILDINNGSAENEQSHHTDSKCSFCYNEDDEQIYRHSDDNSATMCGNCCIAYAKAILEKQEAEDEESESDDEEEISSSEPVGEIITNEMVYSWMNGEAEHNIDIENDARLIINNNDPSAILQATSAYANFLAEQSGQHEDYIRDLLSRLVEQGGLFEASFIPAYKENQGGSDEEAEEAVAEGMLTTDDLWYYFAFAEIENNQKLDFAFSYLACLAGDDNYEPPQEVDLSVLKYKMVQAFQNIASS